MLDRILYKMMPLLLLLALVAVLLPQTSAPLLRWLSQWYYGP